METIITANLSTPERLDGDKNATSFIKDGPTPARYSLADTADGRESGMDYHLQIIKPEDKVRVLKFLRRFFFRDEPLNQSIQLIPEGEDSTCIELEEYCTTSSLDNNLSLMAVSSSGAVIGVILNGKANSSNEDNEGDEEPEYIRNCGNPKFKKILRLLRFVDKNVCATGQFNDQDVLEIRIISVDTNWRGRGVARNLIEKSVEIAKEKNFHAVRADCSSLFSGKLCARTGFKQIYELKYRDYVNKDGNPIFKPAHPHVAVTTYVKKL